MLLQGYKILSGGKNLTLAWRLVIDNQISKEEIIRNNFESPDKFINAVSQDIKILATKNSAVLNRILYRNKCDRNLIAESSITRLESSLRLDKKQDRDIFIDELRQNRSYLTRPLRNLEITVCSILGAKGLGADIVFLIGFDMGKLPLVKSTSESEIYQFLVALTRTKKRIYLVNTKDIKVSSFIDSIGVDNYEILK